MFFGIIDEDGWYFSKKSWHEKKLENKSIWNKNVNIEEAVKVKRPLVVNKVGVDEIFPWSRK